MSDRTMDHMRSTGLTRIVPDSKAEDEWMEYCQEVAKVGLRLHPWCVSWYTGGNIDGKPRAIAPFTGGFDVYTQKLDAVTQDNYKGFNLM